MIDLGEFGALVGDTDLSEQQLLELRAHFYDLARVIVEVYEHRRALAPAGTPCPTR